MSLRDAKRIAAHSPFEKSPARWMRFRVFLAGLFFLLALSGVWSRAAFLQIEQNDSLRSMAEEQYVRAIEIPAKRGLIVDRHGAALAQSVDIDSIWVDPHLLPSLPESAKLLAQSLKLDEKELLARLSRARRFAWIKRQATQSEVAKVQALHLPGLHFAKEQRRYYPHRELAAHLVGVVGLDGHGLDGLELLYERELSGENIRRESIRDAKGRKLATNPLENWSVLEGAKVFLTLDRNIQRVAEKAIAKAVTETQAVAGMAVVMDAQSAELLAIANHPPFNPNLAKEVSKAHMRNRALVDLFEPGSTFKPFVVAAAMEEKRIAADTLWDCEKGRWRVGKKVIHDTHPYNQLTTHQVLQVSSNIGIGKIGQVLGREKLHEYAKSFGFGEKPRTGLPGEAKGLLPYPQAEVSLVNQSFGQGLSVSVLQMAAAYGVLANGGLWKQPYVVSRVVDSAGNVLLENQPQVVRRVISESVAKSVVSMLESVVEKGGTGTQAKLEEYRLAGKTGTAQKADLVVRGYSDKRIASFMGVAPADQPRVVIAVVIDEPQTEVFGGRVAAPVFREIAAELLPYLGVSPIKIPQAASPVAVLADAPEVLPKSAVVEAIERMQAMTDEDEEEGWVRVPDVRGLWGRQAVYEVLSSALTPQIYGSGKVAMQKPPAGVLAPKGTQVLLELTTSISTTSR
ncbi:MAG: penicillin-binding transpeptidase domain-containing protein [Cystobacterineae bacterium]|nr:penicillin-binding transpeptidase domain-containing protein [Cystobacterineae bacterium]